MPLAESRDSAQSACRGKFLAKAGGCVFEQLRQTHIATRKNALDYDASASASSFYTYVGNDPEDRVDPMGLKCNTGSHLPGNAQGCSSSNGDDEVGDQTKKAHSLSRSGSNHQARTNTPSKKQGATGGYVRKEPLTNEEEGAYAEGLTAEDLQGLNEQARINFDRSEAFGDVVAALANLVDEIPEVISKTVDATNSISKIRAHDNAVQKEYDRLIEERLRANLDNKLRQNGTQIPVGPGAYYQDPSGYMGGP
jgi:hypothetical protein